MCTAMTNTLPSLQFKTEKLAEAVFVEFKLEERHVPHYSYYNQYIYTTSREVNEAWRPPACSRPCAFKEKKTKKKKKKSPRTQYTPRNPQQPGDRDHLETACDETSGPYSPASMDHRFVEIGLVQLSQSVKTTNVTHRQTDKQIN